MVGIYILLGLGFLGVASAQTSLPSGQPSGTPTSLPTDFLQTEIEYVASLWVSGAGSTLNFKTRYRELFEQAISGSLHPPAGRFASSQTLVQVVSLVSNPPSGATTVNVLFKVTFIMEKYDYESTGRAFELLTQDLSDATESGALQRSLNESISATYGDTVPGVTISNFRSSISDMEVSYLRTYWPTSMPSEQPYDGPRKKHSVAYSVGAIVIGGAMLIAVSLFLDRRAIRTATHVAPLGSPSASDIPDAKVIIRSAVPFLEVDPDSGRNIERYLPLSFLEAGLVPFFFIYRMARGLFDVALWRHHRWIGPAFHLRYVPRYVRMFTATSYAALMLFFSLFWVRDIQEDHLPLGFRSMTWEFIHALILAVCACGLISSCTYTVIEGWYYTIIASYIRPVVARKERHKGGARGISLTSTTETTSPTRQRRGAAPAMTSAGGSDDNAGAHAEQRPAALSPPRVGAAASNSPHISRRISVRSATMGTSPAARTPPTNLTGAVRAGSTSGPLNLVVSRRNNIRPINSNDASNVESSAQGPTEFSPVPTRFSKLSVPVSRSGVHNVSRLQEEILYCRGTLINGDKPSTTSKQNHNRRTDSIGTHAAVTLGLKRCHEFDCIWGLNKFGRISENRPTSTIANSLYGRKRSSFQLIVSDLFSVHRAAGIELRKMQRPSMKLGPCFHEAEHLRRNRRRIVQLFHLDVLPPLDRAIVYNQISRHERLTEPVTIDRRVKIVGLIQIVLCFLVTVFCIYWFSRPVSEKRQTSIVIIFLFWLGLDVLVVSTLSLVLKHVFLPEIATDEVNRVASWMLKTLDQLFGSISAGVVDGCAGPNDHKNSKNSFSAGHKQKELYQKIRSNIAGDINTSNMPAFVSLNAAHHFFLSSRIAGLFPISYPEIKAIFSFHTLWPKRNMDVLYNARIEALKKKASEEDIDGNRLNIVHSDGSVNIDSFDAKSNSTQQITPPAQWMWYPKLLPYILIYYFLRLPLRVQDAAIDMFSWGITLGTLYLHAWLYQINPFFLMIPIPGVLILSSLCFMSGVFRDAKLQNYPRSSKDVGLWVIDNKLHDDAVGLETLYVHDALREKMKNDDQMLEAHDYENPKSDFMAAMAAARDIEEEDSDEDEGQRGLSSEEYEAAKKEKMMRSLEAEINLRTRVKRRDSGPTSPRGNNENMLESLRPTPLAIKSPIF